jgi:hypothetical protein
MFVSEIVNIRLEGDPGTVSVETMCRMSRNTVSQYHSLSWSQLV